jgi:hypothetical protein
MTALRSERSQARVVRAILLAVAVVASPSRAFGQGEPAHESAAAGQPAETPGFLGEPRAISRALDFATRLVGDGGSVKNGFYPEFGNMPTGAGWISAGPGYRHWLAGDRIFVDGSAAVSWRTYKMIQGRIELPQLLRSRLTVGTQARWQDLTQVTYFGNGPASLEEQRSEYRLKSANVVGYATLRPRQWLSIGGRGGWVTRPSTATPAGSFKRGYPATQDVFPLDPVFARGEQPDYGYGEVSVAADDRDHRSHPTRGGVYRAAWSRYSDRETGGFSFGRSELEAARFLPLVSSRVVLAAHAWLVATHAADGRVVPFYLEPSLGGHNTLRGYADYRFHDRSMLVLNLESRIALFTHLDAAVFADAGNVAPRVADLNIDRRSYGVGLRMHTRRATFARFDVARGSEGWRFLFRMKDPLHLSRLTTRTAPVPFVP